MGNSAVQLYEFVLQNDAGQARYYISCTNQRAALKVAHRLASQCAVKVFANGLYVGEAEHTRWKWNARWLLQNPRFRDRA